jgi:hypothetical protein
MYTFFCAPRPAARGARNCCRDRPFRAGNMMVLAAALLLLPAWLALCSAAPGQQTPVMGYSSCRRKIDFYGLACVVPPRLRPGTGARVRRLARPQWLRALRSSLVRCFRNATGGTFVINEFRSRLHFLAWSMSHHHHRRASLPCHSGTAMITARLF